LAGTYFLAGKTILGGCFGFGGIFLVLAGVLVNFIFDMHRFFSRQIVYFHPFTVIIQLSQKELRAGCRPTETGAGPSDARIVAAASHFTGVLFACA